jgi:hypothetical protein
MPRFGPNTNEPFSPSGLEVLSLTHHGWRIEILPQLAAFTFQCYPPELDDFVDAGEYYDDQERAVQAAYDFVEREIAIRALLEIASEWFWDGLITEAEYWHLTNFA